VKLPTVCHFTLLPENLHFFTNPFHLSHFTLTFVLTLHILTYDSTVGFDYMLETKLAFDYTRNFVYLVVSYLGKGIWSLSPCPCLSETPSHWLNFIRSGDCMWILVGDARKLSQEYFRSGRCDCHDPNECGAPGHNSYIVSKVLIVFVFGQSCY